ncbi:MAG: hypothetical protein ABIJ45_02830, partial [Candidatus Zixiibacteriota bacterium]
YRSKILIIDDFHLMQLNVKYQKKFLDIITDIFNKIIIFSSNLIKYDEHRFIELSDFMQYEILPFGHLLRDQLIEKWISMGQEETIDIKLKLAEIDYSTRHINSIIRKNIVPSKPLYILTILQTLDNKKTSDFGLTSYGHCYQSLIHNALMQVNIKPQDFDPFINFLMELAYFIFKSGKESIGPQQFESFKEEYKREFILDSNSRILETLLMSGIIKQKDSRLYFRYKYIYYFYTAKYLADYLEKESCKKDIENLWENLHTEKNAHILIFLVHHCKRQEIIDEILLNSMVVFDCTEEASINIEETKYLSEFLDEVPELIIKQKDVE